MVSTADETICSANDRDGSTPDTNDAQMLAAELSRYPAVAKQTLMQVALFEQRPKFSSPRNLLLFDPIQTPPFWHAFEESVNAAIPKPDFQIATSVP
jgi:hypothetical protein